jgi:predicted GNAT family acetyltransferase
VALLIQHDPKAQEFSVELSGYRAVLQYRYADRVMTIAHIKVPAAIRGRGVAAELARSALRVARQEGWTVNPECPYARAFMRRYHEYADLMSATVSLDAPASAPAAAGERQADHEHVDALLDEALEESFPASDPPAVGGET